MSILNFKRKEKKITLKYFLRKDYGNGNPQGTDFYYPLYIEFIHRRKKNKCRSLFSKFYRYDEANAPYIKNLKYSTSPTPYIDYNKLGVSSKEFNETVERKINDDASLARTYKLDFTDLLICEKQHALSLFKLLEDISDDDFTFSNLREGYHYSLNRRAFDLYDECLKELLLDEFNQSLPSFPIKVLQMALPSYSFEDFSHTLIDILSMTKKRVETNRSTTTLGRYAFELWNIRELIRQYINSDPYSYLTLTIPIWFLDDHSTRLRNFVDLEGKVVCDRSDVSILDIRSFSSAVETVFRKAEGKFDNEIINYKSYFGYKHIVS